MDVEKNPGPDENFVTLMQNVDWRFSKIMQGIQMHTAYINCKMDEKFGSLERTLGQLTADVNKLKQYVGKDREDIQLLQEDNDKIVQRLEQLEQELAELIRRGFQEVQSEISWSKGTDKRQLQSQRQRDRWCTERMQLLSNLGTFRYTEPERTG